MSTQPALAHASGLATFGLAALALAALAITGCGRSDAAAANAGSSAGPTGGTGSGASTVRTATPPTDDCGWIPAAEVEARGGGRHRQAPHGPPKWGVNARDG